MTLKDTPPRAILAWSALLLLLFAVRTLYGLCADFWSPDEKQVYLVGLKFFTTGQWPYFGPDVVYLRSQIPGALLGLLVGLPLHLARLPEAPAVALNLLSFGGLALLAWYLGRRLGDLPRGFVWIWVMTCPWAMVLSTKVINPSYVLPFAVLFFAGLFETVVFAGRPILPPRLCFLLMGLSIGAIMQLHLSWPLLVPLALTAIGVHGGRSLRTVLRAAGAVLAGWAVGAATLLPTVFAYGLGGSGGVERNVVFQPANILEAGTVLARFLSFASFEVPYMLGPNTAARLEVVRAHVWMAPFAAVLLVAGIVQVLFFAVSFFLRNPAPEWNRLRWLTLASVVLTWLGFFFSVKGPSSHTFYLMFPLAMTYSMYCYRRLLAHRRRLWTWVAGLLLVSGLVFHLGLGLDNLRRRSLYVDRPRVVEAIQQRDYRILGARNADEWSYGY